MVKMAKKSAKNGLRYNNNSKIIIIMRVILISLRDNGRGGLVKEKIISRARKCTELLAENVFGSAPAVFVKGFPHTPPPKGRGGFPWV